LGDSNINNSLSIICSNKIDKTWSQPQEQKEEGMQKAKIVKAKGYKRLKEKMI